jgi:hypothetical protein
MSKTRHDLRMSQIHQLRDACRYPGFVAVGRRCRTATIKVVAEKQP